MMNASTKLSAPLRGAALALLVSMPVATPAWAQAPAQGSPTPPAFPSVAGEPVAIGPVTGQPEYDSVGYVLTQACTLRPILSPTPRAVGEVTGEAERDTFGFVVQGETPCTSFGTLR